MGGGGGGGGGCAAAGFHHSGTALFTGLAAVLAYSCLAASGAHLSVCSLWLAEQNDRGR